MSVAVCGTSRPLLSFLPLLPSPCPRSPPTAARAWPPFCLSAWRVAETRKASCRLDGPILKKRRMPSPHSAIASVSVSSCEGGGELSNATSKEETRRSSLFSRTSPSPFLCRYIGLSGKGEEVSGHVPQDAESRGRGRGGQERPSRGRVSLCPIKQHGRRAISVYPHADAHDASRVTWGGGSSSCWCGDGGAGVCTPERRSSCRSHPGSRGSKWATRDVSRHHVCPSFPSSRFFSTTSVSEVEGEGGTRLHHLHEGAGGGGGGGLKKNATTLKVWKPHAEALRRALKQAEFVALDVELTGLHMRSEKFVGVDRCYEAHCDGARSFLPVQLGLCAARRANTSEPHRWVLTPASIYMFPRESRVFNSSTATLSFLRENGFDFNAWIEEGVPHTRAQEEKEKKDQLQARIDDLVQLCIRAKQSPGNRGGCLSSAAASSPKNPVPVEFSTSPEDRQLADVVRASIRSWLALGTKEPLQLPIDSPLQRLLLHSLIASEFPTLFSHSVKVGDTRVLAVYQSEEEVYEEQIRRLREEMQRVEDLRGVRQLLDDIAEKKLVVIGHNCFYDFLHIFQTLYGDLPRSVADFKKNWIEIFPFTFDTKLIAESHDVLASLQPPGTLKGLCNFMGALSTFAREQQREEGGASGQDALWRISFPRGGDAGLDAPIPLEFQLEHLPGTQWTLPPSLQSLVVPEPSNDIFTTPAAPSSLSSSTPLWSSTSPSSHPPHEPGASVLFASDVSGPKAEDGCPMPRPLQTEGVPARRRQQEEEEQEEGKKLHGPGDKVPPGTPDEDEGLQGKKEFSGSLHAEVSNLEGGLSSRVSADRLGEGGGGGDEDYSHDAGYDSMMTSVVFLLQLAHILPRHGLRWQDLHFWPAGSARPGAGLKHQGNLSSSTGDRTKRLDELGARGKEEGQSRSGDGRRSSPSISEELQALVDADRKRRSIVDLLPLFLNRIRLSRTQPASINLGGKDEQLQQQKRLLLMKNHPSHWKKWEIMKIWSPVWVDVQPVDSSTCWIVARDEEDMRNILTIYEMIPNPEFELLNYEQYRALQQQQQQERMQ